MTVSLLSEIQSVAPDEINKRGIALFKNRTLSLITGTKDSNLKVKVPGNVEDHYIVEVPSKNSKKISCSCIYSQSYPYCKHIVAALLFVDELKRDAIEELDFTVKDQPYNNATPQPQKIRVNNKRKVSSQIYYIEIPEDATDFSWLIEDDFYPYDLWLESISLNGEILECQVEDEYGYEGAYETVEFSCKGDKIILRCSCNEITTETCEHEDLVLHHIKDDYDIKILKHLNLKYQNQLKLKYLQRVMPQVPEQEVDDYVKVVFTDDIYAIPHKKAEGLYHIQKTAEVLNNSISVFSGQNRWKFELPKERSGAAKPPIHGYVYTFNEENSFLIDITLVQGKPNKKRDKIASNLRQIILLNEFHGDLPPDAIEILRLKNNLEDLSYKIENVQDYDHLNSLFQVSSEIFSLVKDQLLYYKVGNNFIDIRKSELIITSVISKKATISFKLEEEDAFYKLKAFCHLEEADILVPVSELKMVHAFIGLYQDKLFHLGRLKDYAVLQHAIKYPVKRAVKDDYDQFYKGVIAPLQQNFNVNIKMQNAEVKKYS